MRQIIVKGTNGTSRISACLYEPVGEVKGIIYFAHGVTEYAERHDEFLKYLSNLGFVVVANDHMGHGNSTSEAKMYFTGTNTMTGWECAVGDAFRCISNIKEEHPNVPVHAIGFSLGSFIVRHLAIKYHDLFSSITLLGTGYQGNLAIKLGKMMADSEIKKFGDKKGTAKIDGLTFGTYNKRFEQKTYADWLCANKKSLQEYLNDKRVGPGFTAGLFLDLLSGMHFTCDKKNIAKMNKKCPVLMVSGSQDAVGDFTKGVYKLQKIYNDNGISATAKTFSGMRHDVLHETGKHNVHFEVANFILSNTKGAKK